jgi:hypothetical protein
MNLAQIQAEAVKLAIATNPTTVTVSRVEYEPDGGGRKRTESTVGPFTILMAGQARDGRSQVDEGGEAKEADWLALADVGADFRWGPNVEDTFSVSGLGTFRVKHTRPVTIEGQTAGYELRLELVV